MTIFHYKLLGFLAVAGFFGLNTVRYWRRRHELRHAYARREGLARDGWLTTADEAGYVDLYNDLQREAYSTFGHHILGCIRWAVSWGLITLAADALQLWDHWI